MKIETRMAVERWGHRAQYYQKKTKEAASEDAADYDGLDGYRVWIEQRTVTPWVNVGGHDEQGH